MNVKITKHFNYSTPFSEADNDDDLAHIMRLKYPKACNNLERDAGFFARMVDEVKQFSAWRVIGFKSFEDFCRAELGKTLEEVEQIISGVRILQAQGRTTKIPAKEAIEENRKRARKGELGRGRPKEDSCYDVTPIRGNRQDYLAARLNRDFPEIAERIKTGEIKSIWAGARAAGIIKTKSPLEQLLHWWGKASESERTTFLAQVT
jgi:hypothetical protein